MPILAHVGYRASCWLDDRAAFASQGGIFSAVDQLEKWSIILPNLDNMRCYKFLGLRICLYQKHWRFELWTVQLLISDSAENIRDHI